jgi:hypothetical protein
LLYQILKPFAMKLSLLLCALVLSVPGWCASAIPSERIVGALTENARITGNGKPHKAISKPLRERQLYYKGKGTMGLILGLALGPVGYAGVHIFSHNQTMRDKAMTGMGIWIGVVVVGGLVWWGIASKVSLDDILLGTLQALAQGSY